MFVLVGAILIAPGIHPQDSVTTGYETPPGDRSFYFGHPVDHPEGLSGVWEAPDGNGGAVGIHLLLTTALFADADPPVWTPQTWQHLDFAVFQRKGAEIVFGEDENYFADNARGSSVTLEDDRLQLHFVSARDKIPSVDVDLVYQPDACWHGRFHRGSFDSIVSLCRPTPGPQVTQSPLVGTWSVGSIPGSACIHIAQTGASTFTGWSDYLQIPGHIIYRPNDPGPHLLYQSYGNLAKVHLTGDGRVSLELGAYNPMCCSRPFTGHLAANGTMIEGDFPPSPNHIPGAGMWIKVHGNACVDPATLPQPLPKPCPSGKN